MQSLEDRKQASVKKNGESQGPGGKKRGRGCLPQKKKIRERRAASRIKWMSSRRGERNFEPKRGNEKRGSKKELKKMQVKGEGYCLSARRANPKKGTGETKRGASVTSGGGRENPRARQRKREAKEALWEKNYPNRTKGNKGIWGGEGA